MEDTFAGKVKRKGSRKTKKMSGKPKKGTKKMTKKMSKKVNRKMSKKASKKKSKKTKKGGNSPNMIAGWNPLSLILPVIKAVTPVVEAIASGKTNVAGKAKLNAVLKKLKSKK